MIERNKLDLIFKAITIKNAWPDVSEWKNYHFQTLAIRIQEETDIHISIETLRRLSGKRKDYQYKNLPQLDTRNALAKVAGYESWDAIEVPTITINDSATKSVVKPTKRVGTILIALATALLVGVYLSFYFYNKYTLNPTVTGTLRTKTTHFFAPNTVAFTYSIANRQPNDTLFIDFGYREVALSGKHYTLSRLTTDSGVVNHSFLTPDLYKVRLITKHNTVLDSVLVLASNQSWETYYTSNDILTNKVSNRVINQTLTYPERLFNNSLMHIKDELWTEYRFVDTTHMDGDDFVFSAVIENSENTFGNMCYDSDILIRCRNGIVKTTFLYPNCDQWVKNTLSELELDGSKTNMKMYGVAFLKPTKVTIQNKNKEVCYFVNDSLIDTRSYKQPLGEIVGIVIRFKGGGTLRDVKLTNSAKRSKDLAVL